MIYFIYSGSGQYVKIGHTDRDPNERLREIQIGNPNRLEIVATIPGDRDKERELHDRFHNYHTKGEWFRCQGALKQYVIEVSQCAREVIVFTKQEQLTLPHLRILVSKLDEIRKLPQKHITYKLRGQVYKVSRKLLLDKLISYKLNCV